MCGNGEPSRVVPALGISEGESMPPENPTPPITELTPEERRERRRLRREKQRESNNEWAAKMHKVRLKMEAEGPVRRQCSSIPVNVGCSGWRVKKWRDSFYQEVPTLE